MHKENCTVSFVMSERVLNMNNVIYNSGFAINVYHTKRFSSAAPYCEGFKERYGDIHVTLKVGLKQNDVS